jgi:hypothetical protein
MDTTPTTGIGNLESKMVFADNDYPHEPENMERGVRLNREHLVANADRISAMSRPVDGLREPHN